MAQSEEITARFGDDYVARFDKQAADRHIGAITQLSSEKPVVVQLEKASDELIDCTIIAFDHPFEFSCITGIMAGTGFSIESSDSFTLPRVKSKQKVKQTVLKRRDPAKDAVILDHFRGRLMGPITEFGEWSRVFEPAIVEVIRLLDQEDEESTDRAKRLVNERVTQWLRQRREGNPRATERPPVDVTIEQLPQATRLRLRAPDVPAFLYALSTSLSLHGLQIERTRVQTIAGQAIDEIDLTDLRGKPLDSQRVQQLRISVTLTHQFAFFLDGAPDPFSALKRFEALSEKIVNTPQRQQWLELLANSLSMSGLAKVLGASDYLWDDFIKLNADALLPVFQRHVHGQALALPARNLPRRLQDALGGARHFDEQRAQLNEFKDNELLLIDLDHMLSMQDPDEAFETLSERLVLLAECLVGASARLVYEELVRLYGSPRDQAGKEVSYAIFGLGKLGGVALGYASDIELLFLFSADGKTSGGTRGAMPNDEFFAIFTRETSDSIHAKREGIFNVDLRLRPFGKGGPLACSAGQFENYYGPKGAAHAFERLVLVRLRWIAGDPQLGFHIEQIRDRLVYESAPSDRRAITEISEKMRAQHLEGKKLNSKYSVGGLVDLEQTVQLLQVMHAKDAPQLRTPKLQEAIDSLRRAGVLSPAEFDELLGAYQFLRRLINAQRILHGSAQDLFLPAAGSDELIHLARRMNHAPDELLKDFHRHTSAVRQFIKRRL